MQPCRLERVRRGEPLLDRQRRTPPRAVTAHHHLARDRPSWLRERGAGALQPVAHPTSVGGRSHDPVERHDADGVVGEECHHDRRVRTDGQGRRRAMVAVGHVGDRDGREGREEPVHSFRVSDGPELLANAIRHLGVADRQVGFVLHHGAERAGRHVVSGDDRRHGRRRDPQLPQVVREVAGHLRPDVLVGAEGAVAPDVAGPHAADQPGLCVVTGTDAVAEQRTSVPGPEHVAVQQRAQPGLRPRERAGTRCVHGMQERQRLGIATACPVLVRERVERGHHHAVGDLRSHPLDVEWQQFHVSCRGGRGHRGRGRQRGSGLPPRASPAARTPSSRPLPRTRRRCGSPSGRC